MMLATPTADVPTNEVAIMSTNPPFQQVLGQTEKALNAILDRQLAGTGLTEHHWITLTLTVSGGGTLEHDQLIGRVADALKGSEAQAQTLVTELSNAGLLDAAGGNRSVVTVTPAGRQLHTRIRAAVTEITERMWGDVPAEDLDTASRVLNTIRARANAELAGG
jgi:DNA-binding MarR family transcriptional regulator